MGTTDNFQEQQFNKTIYAGFWWRFLAYLIDNILLDIITSILFGPFIALYFLSYYGIHGGDFADPGNDFETLAEFLQYFGPVFLVLPLMLLASLAIWWLYYALLESSRYQGTLGKILLGIKVTDMEGQRISFSRASGRLFGKILSGIILMIGYLMAGFTEKKQALHDILSDCLVVKQE